MAAITKVLSFVILTICSLLVVTLVFYNGHSAELKVFPPLNIEFTIPMFLLVGLVFLMGFCVGALWVWLGGIKYRRGLRQSTKKVRQLEDTVEEQKQELAKKSDMTGQNLAQPTSTAVATAA